MLSRRTVITGALAASASFRSIAQAQNPPAGGPDGNAPPRTILQLQRRNIVVNGKPASVYGIRQPDGTIRHHDRCRQAVSRPCRKQNRRAEPDPLARSDAALAAGRRARHFRPADPTGRHCRLRLSRCALAAPFGCIRIRGCRSSY